MAPSTATTTNQETQYLSTLRSVRERCFRVQEAATRNKLQHFEMDASKLDDMVTIVVSLMKRDFVDTSEVPQFSRWRHFDAGGKKRIQEQLIQSAWAGIDPMEQTRRLIDLFVVAVLLDIDFGATYAYREQATGRVYKDRDGVAVAVFDMYMAGTFSSDSRVPHRVDSEALLGLSLETLVNGMQAKAVEALNDRVDLLRHLGQLLGNRQDYFGAGINVRRPGNLMDYLMAHPTTINTKKGPLIHLETLWPIVQEMGELWAAADETAKGGTPDMGDVWPCQAIRNPGSLPQDHLVSFHLLSQWLVYSLVEPMEKLLGATIEGTEQLTVLPEARNGGLLIDTGFLTLKSVDLERGIENYRKNALLPGQPKMEVVPMFDLNDPVVVEWRALTVAYLDIVAERVRTTLNASRKSLSLSQLIQGGTWSAGRELAEISRPNTQEPPIAIKPDRRVFY